LRCECGSETCAWYQFQEVDKAQHGPDKQYKLYDFDDNHGSCLIYRANDLKEIASRPAVKTYIKNHSDRPVALEQFNEQFDTSVTAVQKVRVVQRVLAAAKTESDGHYRKIVGYVRGALDKAPGAVVSMRFIKPDGGLYDITIGDPAIPVPGVGGYEYLSGCRFQRMLVITEFGTKLVDLLDSFSFDGTVQKTRDGVLLTLDGVVASDKYACIAFGWFEAESKECWGALADFVCEYSSFLSSERKKTAVSDWGLLLFTA
jgi:hypothetical protein